MEQFAVFTSTREDYNQLMEWAEALGFSWNEQKATGRSRFEYYGESTVIYFRPPSKRLTISALSGYQELRSDVPCLSMEDFAFHHGLETPLPDDYF